jgi:hypothetical protein
MRRWSFFRRVSFDLISATASAAKSGLRKLVEGLALRENVLVTMVRRVAESVSITEVVRFIRLKVATVAETLALSDFAQVKKVIRQLITETLGVTENVLTKVIQYLRQTISEPISITEDALARVVQFLKQTVSDGIAFVEDVVASVINVLRTTATETLSITESVQATTQRPSRWDYYQFRDQNGASLTMSDAPLQDNDTSTYISLAYSPSVPSNPRSVLVGWNTAKFWTQISVYVVVMTGGQKLQITVYDSFGNSEPYTINPSVGNGWYTIPLWYVMIAEVKEILFSPDTNVLGDIGVAEINFE